MDIRVLLLLHPLLKAQDCQRATKGIKGLKHHSCEEMLRELGMLILDLIDVYTFSKGGC